MRLDNKSDKVNSFLQDFKDLLAKYDASIVVESFGTESEGGYMNIKIPGEEPFYIDDEDGPGTVFTLRSENLLDYVH